ncbi:Transcription factor [Sporothrix epigloea]|uniref:Transcription factor n=1 Tax=Sporothrix epigloea TaxID=1892477 RepID=A0ABP0E0C7_9PEZI
MSSPDSTAPGESNGAASTLGPDEKPRLTELEKKQNHIASEQKRRQAIREGFDRMTELVPGLEGQGRSEGLVLQKTVEFMKKAIEERERLIREIESRGGTINEKDRLHVKQ